MFYLIIVVEGAEILDGGRVSHYIKGSSPLIRGQGPLLRIGGEVILIIGQN
jgi:hypothetical protein